MAGPVPGRHSCMSQELGSNWRPRAQQRERLGKSGPTFSWPIRTQNSLITFMNYMPIGKTWIKCTMPVLSIITEQNKYSPRACHGSDMFPPEARPGVKHIHKGHATTWSISRDPRCLYLIYFSNYNLFRAIMFSCLYHLIPNKFTLLQEE